MMTWPSPQKQNDKPARCRKGLDNNDTSNDNDDTDKH